ncbi:MAG: hypothetical protein QXS85_01355 [Acidilobaceae archaeon]
MELKVKTPLLIAEGQCLAVSAYLDAERLLPIPSRALKAAILAFTLGDVEALKTLDWRDAVIAYAMVYGGLVLSYTCGPTTPISRLYVDTGISIEESRGARFSRRLGDSTILKAWALLASGEEDLGLKMIQGLSSYPRALAWRHPGSVKLSPSPISVTVSARDLELLKLNPSYLDEIIRPWS